MERKKLEKEYTICLIIYSFILIVDIWYATMFSPNIYKEVLCGILLIMNFSYFFCKQYKKRKIPISFYIFSSVLYFVYTCSWLM